MNGSAGIVLMSPRKPEVDKHTIPEELGYITVETLNNLGGDRLIVAHQVMQVLRIKPLGERGRADQITEQDGQIPALDTVFVLVSLRNLGGGRPQRGCLSPDRLSAAPAELEPSRRLCSTAGAAQKKRAAAGAAEPHFLRIIEAARWAEHATSEQSRMGSVEAIRGPQHRPGHDGRAK